MTGRLFAALYPSAAAVTDLELVTAALPSLKRPAPSHQWHVTIAFVGVAGDPAPVRAALAEAGGRTLRLRVAGGGAFGRPGRDSVLWAGLEGDLAGLHALGDDVRAALDRHGVAYDERPLRPHLTLGRDDRDLGPDLALLDAYRGPWWETTELLLVESSGGEYRVLDRYPSRSS
ncbi:hypothetical protein Afil01_56780 [Actinorhabdospora filicis]|uniref:RNA 2',3'-cyclic phosphodiesterase n=1 Tax=Actinorhabdospora filicis TaxID=1785913 RepID=A0A9W6WCS0_9ACTN|nr:RNA 2',3'-cyclic phosphodiesterase [Actinorhabdospora filicis]GLZ80871.1 hypothetical protein Afil01_56780 [Actinorhabdospora filicis]